VIRSVCQRKGCGAPAACGLALNVPAKGWAIDQHQPLRVVIGIVLCDLHFSEVKPSDFCSAPSDMRPMIRAASAGRATPDFTRAFLSKVPLDHLGLVALKDGYHPVSPDWARPGRAE